MLPRSTAHSSQMDLDPSDHAVFEARLHQTVTELRHRVQEQQRALQELRSSSRVPVPHAPSSDTPTRLQQLRLLKHAYERITPSAPPLPSPASALPMLLATRVSQQSITDAKDAIENTREKLAVTERQLEREGGNLQDSNAITRSLESRIEHLREQDQEKSKKSASQVAKDLLNAARKRKQSYGAASSKLQSALESFVDEHLASLLAAEELGGPVVGELMDVDDDMLTAGFSHQGKPKAIKHGRALGDTKRQRRIDEVWGAAAGSNGQPLNEKDAAGAEIQSLIEELYSALMGESSGGEYIALERDSAAARFLVRSKVAQFHPRDARKLRLIDFGRDLDD